MSIVASRTLNEFPPDNWVNLTVTIDLENDTTVFYQDGVMLGTTEVGLQGNVNLSSPNNIILGKNNDSTLFFEGEMDAVNIRNDILTQADVLANFTRLRASSILNTNVWNHLVTTFSSYTNKVEVFINGNKYGEYPNYQVTTLVDNSSNIVVGKSFDGSVAEVLIAQRKLFPEEINYLNEDSNGRFLQSNTILIRYNFESPTQDTECTDVGGLNNHGNFANVPVYEHGFVRNSHAVMFDGTQKVTIPNVSINSLDFNQMNISILMFMTSSSTTLIECNAFKVYVNSSNNICVDYGESTHVTTITVNTIDMIHFGLHFNKEQQLIKEYFSSNPSNVPVLVNTTTIADLNIPAVTSDITIGDGFIGKLDDLHIELGWSTPTFVTASEYQKTRVISKFDFDESTGMIAYDSSSLNNNASLINSPIRKTPSYKPNSRGLVFDATKSQSVNVPGSVYSGVFMDNITITFWMKTTLVTGVEQTVVSRDGMFTICVDGTNGYVLVKHTHNGVEHTCTSAIHTVDSDTWNHVTVLIDSFNSEIGFFVYKQGGETNIETDSCTFNNQLSVSDIIIGGDSFTGELDSVMLYRGILDITSIIELSSDATTSVYEPVKITSDEWSHVAVVYNEKMNMSCTYLNGEYNGCYEKYLTDYSTVGSNTNSLYIGTTEDMSDHFDGVVDDIRVYDTALSHDNVKQVYNMYNPVVMLVEDFVFDATSKAFESITLNSPLVPQTVVTYAFATLTQRFNIGNDYKAFLQNDLANISEGVVLSQTTSSDPNFLPSLTHVIQPTGTGHESIQDVNMIYTHVVSVYDRNPLPSGDGSSVWNDPVIFYKKRHYQLNTTSEQPSGVAPYVRIDRLDVLKNNDESHTLDVFIKLLGTQGVASYSIGLFLDTVDTSALLQNWPANKSQFTTTVEVVPDYEVRMVNIQVSTLTDGQNTPILEDKYKFVVVIEDGNTYGVSETNSISTIVPSTDYTVIEQQNIEIHKLMYMDSYIAYTDRTSTPMRSGMGGTGDDYILKTPQPESEIVGDLIQIVTNGDIVLALDSNKHLYVQFNSMSRQNNYSFFVDPTEVIYSDIPYTYSNKGYFEFVRATNLETILDPRYGVSGENTQVKKIHAANRNGFFIEYANGSIHLILGFRSVHSTNAPAHAPYFSVHTTNTITSLPNPDPNVISWTLVNTLKTGWASGLVFFKRTGASAPYHAFQNETTQYGVNDTSNGNNVRVFVLTVNAYDQERDNIGTPTEGQYTTSPSLGLLSSSTGTIGISNATNTSVSVLAGGS